MKRRLCMMALIVCLMFGILGVEASAESAASKVDIYCTVNIDGDCMVSMNVNLHLEEPNETLTFPLPANATNITMNGVSVGANRTGSSMEVPLSRATGGLPGEFPIRFEFNIPKAVKVNESRQLVLTVPLLCGFSYPVSTLSYTVTVPKEITGRPDFYSTYRQNSIASDLVFNVNGSMVTGSSKNVLNDHEAITMTMLVPQDMFPSVSTYIREGNPEVVPMLCFFGAALLYWLLTLRALPPRRDDSTMPIEGTTAGELGCRLTLSGGDLTMMVMSWAQMGYLIIHLDGNGRILLHRRMEMGNERSLFEVRVFRTLFGSRRTVDCTGLQYAKFCRKTAGMVPGEKYMCRKTSGNPKLFRYLCCIAQAICGVCMTMNLTTSLFLQILLGAILTAFGLVSAWFIQGIAYRVWLRGKLPVYVGIGCIIIWIVIGWIAGPILIPLGAVAGQLLVGYMAAYGGLRSDLNKLEVSQILGLRYYLRHISKKDVDRMLNADPDYFFRMAPYAIALGVMKPFAAAFGKRKLEQCPYLVTRIHGKRTASDWAELMEQTANLMDMRYHQLQLERFSAIRFR